mgnify:FL=1
MEQRPGLPRVGDPERPLAAPVMQRGWQRIRKRAGLDDVHLHDVCHTFGTTASRSGGNAFQIRGMLRHADIAMSARYPNADAEPTRVLVETEGAVFRAGMEHRAE